MRKWWSWKISQS